MLLKHHKFMWGFTKNILVSLARPVMLYLITVSLTLQALFATLFYFIEHSVNPQIPTFFDSCYYVVTVTTGVGLGDITPLSIPGKLLSMLMMLAGTAIYVTFTAVLSVSILEVELVLKDKK